MIDTVGSGNIGNLLMQVNSPGFFKVAALSVKTMQTRNSMEVSQILDETSAMLAGDQGAAEQASAVASGSPDLNSQISGA